MAPAVNNFIRNREYERPEKTSLQKGADILGKIALAGGTLAAAHAIGGGFKGNAAQKVAEAVGTAAVGKDFGISGGGTSPYTNYPSGGDLSGNVNLDGAVKAVTDTVLPPKPTASAQIASTPVEKTDEFLNNLTNRRTDAGGLSRMERLSNRERFGERPDLIENEISDEYARRRRVEKGLEGPSPEEQFNLHTTGSYFDWDTGEPSVNQVRTAQKKLNMPELPPGMENMVTTPNIDVLEENWKSKVPGSPQIDPPSDGGGTPLGPTPTPTPPTSPTDIVSPDDPGGQRLAGGVQKANTSLLGRVGNTVLGTARGVANKLDQEPWGAQREKAIASNLAYGIAARGFGLGPQGGRMAGTGFNEGATQGILSRVGNLPIIRQGLTEPLQKMGDYSVFRGADVNLPNWLGGGFSVPGIPTGGQMLTGFLANNPDAAAFANAGGVTLAEGAGLGTGLFLGGAAKDAAKAALIAERAIRPVGRAVGQAHNNVLVPAGKAIAGFHGNYLVPQGRQFHQNVLVPAGREFHQNVLVPGGNSALDGIQRNLNALKASAEQQLNIKGQLAAVSESLLPTTRASGEVIIGDNHQLNRSPDLPPGESMMKVPSRAIQQFADKDIYGAGSRTPDYFEIRTDLDVSDPVEVTSGFYQETKRPSKAEKKEFRAGLRERNKDIYESAENLPERRIGKGFDWRTGRRSAKGGSGGEAASRSGTIDYSSTDDRPQDPIWQWVKGFTEPMNIEKEDAARRLGNRIAEDEFPDPW